VRLKTSSADNPPDFTQEHLRPRVLVEEEDGAVRAAIVEMLEDAGFESVGCGGPDTQASPTLRFQATAPLRTTRSAELPRRPT